MRLLTEEEETEAKDPYKDDRVSTVSGISNVDEWTLLNNYAAYQTLQEKESHQRAKREV